MCWKVGYHILSISTTEFYIPLGIQKVWNESEWLKKFNNQYIVINHNNSSFPYHTYDSVHQQDSFHEFPRRNWRLHNMSSLFLQGEFLLHMYTTTRNSIAHWHLIRLERAKSEMYLTCRSRYLRKWTASTMTHTSHGVNLHSLRLYITMKTINN